MTELPGIALFSSSVRVGRTECMSTAATDTRFHFSFGLITLIASPSTFLTPRTQLEVHLHAK